MVELDPAGVFGWIQAISNLFQAGGVIVALIFTALQFKQQGVDAKESARRHEQAERDAAKRHEREMTDRKRERMLHNYPVWSQGVEEYLANMTVAETLRGDAMQFEAVAREKRDAQAKQSALTMQGGAMQHHAKAQAAMARATTAYLGIRFDDSPDHVARIDAVMQAVQEWRNGPTEELVVQAYKLAHDRSDAFRPRASP